MLNMNTWDIDIEEVVKMIDFDNYNAFPWLIQNERGQLMHFPLIPLLHVFIDH